MYRGKEYEVKKVNGAKRMTERNVFTNNVTYSQTKLDQCSGVKAALWSLCRLMLTASCPVDLGVLHNGLSQLALLILYHA